MSLLNEVMEISKEVNIKTIDENVTQLTSKVKDVKEDFEEFIRAVFYEYTRKICKNNYLIKKVDNIVKELSETKNNIEHDKLNAAKTGSHNIEKQCDMIHKLSMQMGNIKQVLKIIYMNQEVVYLKNQKKYKAAILLVKDILNIIKSLPEDEQVKVIKTIRANALYNLSLLNADLTSIFEENINYKGDGKNNYVKIKVYNIEMKEVCLVLFSDNEYMGPVSKFLQFIFDYLFMPIIKKTVNVTISNESNFFNLYVEIVEDNIPHFKKVFAGILQVLKFFHENMQYLLNDEHLIFINYIGDKLAENLSILLIEDCLKTTIPNTMDELTAYKAICEDITIFQSKMAENGVPISLTKFVNNTDTLFMKKKCERYLKNAQDITKKDLHDYLEIGTPYDPNNILQSITLTRCTVSKSTTELMSLINNMMEITKIFPDANVMIKDTIDKILLYYTQDVREYHQKLLQTIPQQVALFYNNCQYLSHELYVLQEMYKEQNVDYSKSLFNLQKVGNEMFQNCVEQHKDENHTIMTECGLIGIETLEKIDPKMEKCICQCLRQQQLLKTVWQKVLSYTDYNKAIGYILNDFCKFLITRILKLVDISSEASEQLVDLMKIIETRGSKLFTDPKEITLYVELWYKFKELEFVLNTNLGGINDRWADGKGPLALQFEPLEMRNLICALFKNTDIRASALSKIK